MKDGIVGIGVVGLGHWGPNHVRVFSQCDGAKVVIAADPSEARRKHIAKLYPQVRAAGSAQEVFSDKEVDAVVIAAPTKTHYALAKAALAAGKHLLLEKPFCSRLKEAQELLRLAGKKKKVLMHGHVFVYNRGIQYVKEGMRRGDFGKIQYLHATRTNLGPIRCDVNVIGDLAAHEFSIFDALFGRLPRWVSAAGARVLKTPREDVAFLTMEYPEGVLAHAHVSWLHPQKIRTLTLVGDKRMVFWSDTDTSEPIKVYDKGVAEEPYYDSFGEFQLRLRDADVLAPKLYQEEPLKLQAQAFICAVRERKRTLCEPETGLRVMQCLEAAQESLRKEGRRVYLRSRVKGEG
ncbi:MAG: Gfo/Idh/MocA family oxidoreductase [Candidatus Omnitrophica bacterium]|nr:Gfo/Idh/MocA family oxidoreductase [Candidatus Omnitrophota bacterium]